MVTIKYNKQNNAKVPGRIVLFVVMCCITANLCWGYGEVRRGAYINQSTRHGSTFKKPVIIISAGKVESVVESIDQAMKYIEVKPRPEIIHGKYSEQMRKTLAKNRGWVEASGKDAADPNRKSKEIGISQIVDVISRLFNGIGSAPMIPFAIASDGDVNTVSSYALGEERTGSVIDIIRQQLITLMSLTGHDEELKENLDPIPNLNDIIKLLT